MRQVVLKQKKVRCNKIFSYDTRRYMLNLHLYFVKLFGCHIVDNKMPINIESFSKAILDKKAHPDLYLSFGHFGISTNKYSGCSEIQCDLLKNGEVAFANWFYQVGALVVNILYAIPGEHRYGLTDAWHPKKALCLNVKNFIAL
ncbi:hypothetical protein [uncultured Legionella sp.]|uniref:hypothetical protein n=1 Tax=uncultured Legionella sp. TaxID=210934 RepID=UPI002630BC4A|nr:hypothetical protein [uncultured Legionella sp.]